MRKVKLEKADPITDDIGLKIRCKVYKNRYAKGNPYKTCEYIAIYGQGIDSISELPGILEREGIFEKSGSWYAWKDNNGNLRVHNGKECKWRSRTVLVDYLKNNPDFVSLVEEEIKKIQEKGLGGISLDAEEISAIEEANKDLENYIGNIEANID